MPVLWTRRRLAQLAGLAALGALQAGFALVVAMAGSRLLAGGGAEFGQSRLMLVLAGATLGLLGLRVLQRRYAEAFALGYVAELRSAFISHVIRLPADAREMRIGLVMTRVVNDLSAIKLWLASGLVAMIVAAAMLTTIAAGLVFLDPQMAVALVFAVGLWCLPVVAGLKPLVSRIRESRRRRGRIAAQAGSVLGASQTLLLHGRHGASVRRIARTAVKMNAALVGRATLSGLLRSSGDVVFPAVALLLTSGILSFGNGALDAEALGILVMITGLTAVQLNAVALGLEYRLAHNVALARLQQVLKIPAIALDSGDAELSRQRGGRALGVEGLPIGGASRAVSFTVEQGETVSLQGVTAAEASDLFLQIAGLKSPRAGSVRIDGQEHSTVSPRDWWRVVTLVSDRLPMIRGTIGDNACLGAPTSVGAGERLRVLERFGLTEEIANTQLNERNRLHAPEQAAAIRAARAVLRRASIVLIDDAALAETAPILEALLDELAALGATVVLSPACGRLSGTYRRIDLSARLERVA